MYSEEPIDSPQLQPLQQAFRHQLLACLEDCAAGRAGLFSDVEHLPSDTSQTRPWPEAASLRQLAFALQSILAQSGESDLLCDQFLDLCTIHGENDPGEPGLARAFLQQIEAGA